MNNIGMTNDIASAQGASTVALRQEGAQTPSLNVSETTTMAEDDIERKHPSPARRKFMGLEASPGRWGIVLAMLPFAVLASAYLLGSHARLEANPMDRLMPSPVAMAEAFWNSLMVPDKRTGTLLLPTDWLASMQRMCLGVLLAAMWGLGVGVVTGLYPGPRRLLLPFVTFASIIPPLALLPILFVTAGTGEAGKVALIFLGLAWGLTRSMHVEAVSLPQEGIVKALTLGAGHVAVALRVVLPQLLPRLIDAVRANLGAAWLFLISAEAIAAQEGLGYRIFLVRRYMAMDVIIPYVAVITLTGFLLDRLLRMLCDRLFPWYAALEGER